MSQNSIGERIKELRKSKNLTQEELANLMNSSRVQINQWETGARELTANRIIEFANALDTSCEYLLRGVPLEKVDSYNHTGLDIHSLNALEDIMCLPEHMKNQYLIFINGVLGSDYFWREVMPHLSSALTIQQNSALGGAYSGLKNFSPESVADKLKSSIELVTFYNTAGYTDHILINKETAIRFQLSEATKAFCNLINAIVEKQSMSQTNPIVSLTKPYQPNKSENTKISIHNFITYLKAMGIELNTTDVFDRKD